MPVTQQRIWTEPNSICTSNSPARCAKIGHYSAPATPLQDEQQQDLWFIKWIPFLWSWIYTASHEYLHWQAMCFF